MDRERLVELVAAEVAALLRSGGTPAQALAPLGVPGDGGPPCHGCSTRGHCATVCPTAFGGMVRAGADRVGATVGVGRVPPDLARYIDHTLLKPEATLDQVTLLCAEAAKHRFVSVCVNPFWVATCKRLLQGHPVKVCTVIGFPLGANHPATKAAEARRAVEEGAEEVDMVVNVGALKSGLDKVVEQDIRGVVEAAGPGIVTKVFLETGLLTDAEKVRACRIAVAAGADFVKTSTGFGPGGATAADIALMRRVVGEEVGVKASGGIRDQEQAVLMIESGASRIGASASVKIVSPDPKMKPQPAGPAATGAY